MIFSGLVSFKVVANVISAPLWAICIEACLESINKSCPSFGVNLSNTNRFLSVSTLNNVDLYEESEFGMVITRRSVLFSSGLSRAAIREEEVIVSCCRAVFSAASFLLESVISNIYPRTLSQLSKKYGVYVGLRRQSINNLLCAQAIVLLTIISLKLSSQLSFELYKLFSNTKSVDRVFSLVDGQL